MRILQVNKFFYVRGGSERYFFDLSGLLAEQGHDLFHFSMSSPRNEPANEAGYFVSEIDLNAPMSTRQRLEAAFRVLYSTEAKRRFGKMLDDLRPDVVHFHNITRQLSPSIIDAAAARGIPMIQTMHDPSLICPAHTCFVDGRTCEACAGGSYWHATAKRCIDGSVASSMLGSLEAYFHAWSKVYDKIGLFIAPSLFLKRKISLLGWIAPKIVHLPYFIPRAPDYTAVNEGFVLFSGRVTEEKGIRTLLEVASLLRGTRFVIAGEGELSEECRQIAGDRGLDNVEFAGYVEGPALEVLLRGAACVVVPSIWYENLPLTILEAFARGIPVAASTCGGSPELVRDGVTGYLSVPGDADSLADSLTKTVGNEAARLTMGNQARELALSEYSPRVHYDRLMGLYEDLRT